MGRTPFYIAAALVLVVLGSLIRHWVWDTTQGPSQMQTAAELAEAARILNAQAPIELDEITTLESAETDNIIMIYNNKVASDASEFDKASFETERRAFLVEFVCGNDGMAITLDAGGSFRYNWVDRSDQFIGSVTISGADCP